MKETAMTRYLMNAAVIPHGCTGTFTYRLATLEELIAFLQAGEVINTIVYPATLTWVKQVTGQRFRVPPEDVPASTLQPGDEAFVIRRVTRRAQDWKQPFDPAVMELGVLRCEPPPKPPAAKRASRARKRA
jgi:hypothetical protein